MATTSQSAGILMFRNLSGKVEVFLVHPGGPFFARKDAGAWSIPKGEFVPGEDPLDVARREFLEETGLAVETCAGGTAPIPLGSIRQRGGKTVHAWAVEGDWPRGTEIRSNTFTLEWPLRSGRLREFPEIDGAEFFPVEVARSKINPAQNELIDRLLEHLPEA